MVPWVPLATVPRPLGQQNTLKSFFRDLIEESLCVCVPPGQGVIKLFQQKEHVPIRCPHINEEYLGDAAPRDCSVLDGCERMVVDVQEEVNSQAICRGLQVFAMANSDTWQEMRQVPASYHMPMAHNGQAHSVGASSATCIHHLE